MAAVSVLVDKATSALLAGPDWATNLEICDLINNDPGQARDVVRAIKKRLSNKSSRVQLLALTVLETIVNNCNEIVHQLVAEKDVLHQMVKIVKKKADMGVRDTILVLLDSWQEAFGGLSGKYPQYYMAYNDLRRSGVAFPKRNSEITAPIFTPPRTHLASVYPPSGYGSPGYAPTRVDAPDAATPWSFKDMDRAQGGTEVLDEMLSALDPRNKQAVRNDVILQLVEQCSSNQKSVMDIINVTSDERLLCKYLALNDDLQRVLSKYDAIASGYPVALEPKAGSPEGLVVYAQEDDETEEEFSQLAHRSSSRVERKSVSSCESRPATTQLALPPPQPIMRPNSPPAEQGLSKDVLSAESCEGTQPIMRTTLDSPTSVAALLAQLHGPSNTSIGIPSLVASVSNQYEEGPSPVFSSNVPPSGQVNPLSHEQHMPSKTQQNPSGYVASWAIASPHSEKEPQTSHENSLPSSHKKAMLHETSSVGGLPPPPILYTQRQKFFEEKTKHLTYQTLQPEEMVLGSLESRPKRLTLLDGNAKQDLSICQLAQCAGSSPARYSSLNVKEANSGRDADRLFEDLVDLRGMSANFKTAGISNRLSRPTASKSRGGM